MTKEKQRIILAFAIPLLCACIFLIMNWVMQPTALYNTENFKTAVLADLNENKLYNLDGEITCYPRVKLLPVQTVSYKGDHCTIRSIKDIKKPEFIQGNNYIATIKLQLLVPSSIEYGVILPGHFCEYTVYCNGEMCAQSETKDHKHPAYPTPKYITLPYSDTGYYNLVINLSTPTDCRAGSYGTNLFGSKEHVMRIQKTERLVIYAILSFVIFILFSCVIQIITFRSDRILHSFLLFTIAALLRVLFSDNIVLIDLIAYIPYRLGTVITTLIVPLFLMSITFHIYTIYEKYFPKKLLLASGLYLIIPILNGLLPVSLSWFEVVAKIASLVPYAICGYVIITAAKDDFFYSFTVILGLTSLLSGTVIELITATHFVPGKYTYVYGVVLLSISQLINLAHIFAEQDEAEISMTEELRTQMEAMQASENAFLNAQMKPHFLYNTLNTIADLCVTDSTKARQLISSLKDYVAMVISLDNMEETVSLSKELKLARTYYKIEKERFPSIDFYEELPIRIPNIQMPPLVIQPLVENAIKHGVRKSTREGVIIIRIKEKPDHVMFQVSDNGKGMTAEQIEKMFEIPKENKSVGIYNINKRLKNLYGQGLTVESTVDLGTCISFNIPKDKKVSHIEYGAKRVDD